MLAIRALQSQQKSLQPKIAAVSSELNLVLLKTKREREGLGWIDFVNGIFRGMNLTE